MKKMSASEIRKSWINFFESKNHFFLPPASLIPKNDPSLLWINSGVATLKDYFSGKKNPPHPRLVNSQKALRTSDLYNVGLTSRHQTLFEMLGNFSIGDYFKIEAIDFAFELLTKVWEIDSNLLWITVFEDDDTTYNYWIKKGIKKDQILKCDRTRNFWDVGNGPCGPCTEIYYDRGEKYDPNKIGIKLMIDDIENDRFVEIWNIVFSQFNNDGQNNYNELLRKNIDTGAGLERIACISQDVPTNFDTDLFQPIIQTIAKYSDKKYDINAYFNHNENQTKMNFYYKVIADHLRASVFAIADGALPSSKDRGYVLRRLIRRAMIMAQKLNIIDNNWYIDAINVIVTIMSDFYEYLKAQKEVIIDVIDKEIKLFKITLSQGLKILQDGVDKKQLDDKLVFDLVTTYGFPIESIKEIADEQKIDIDENAFHNRFIEHQNISRANKNQKAMDNQNSSLLNLDVVSEFDYDKYECEAKVVKIFDENFNEVQQLIGDGYVVFDKTIFYATSGGQVNDTGYINDKYFVNDVFKGPNLQHIHHVNDANLKINEIVNLKINFNDRRINMAHHTSEHLLQAALINLVDSNIKQQGAFKSPQKFTLDFQSHDKLSDTQLENIENWINNVIHEKINVEVLNLELEEAKKIGAIALFDNVYKKIKGKLRVIRIGDKSTELCGGTHVSNTADIEKFSIINHYSKRAGEWRIEAISTFENHNKYRKEFQNKIQSLVQKETNSINNNHLKQKIVQLGTDLIKQLDTLPLRQFQINYNNLLSAINKIKNDFNSNQKDVNKVAIKTKANQIDSDLKLLLFENEYNFETVNEAIGELINETPKIVYVALIIEDNKLQYLITTNKNNSIDLNVYNDLVIRSTNAKGFCKNNFARGGGSDLSNIDQLISKLKQSGFKDA